MSVKWETPDLAARMAAIDIREPERPKRRVAERVTARMRRCLRDAGRKRWEPVSAEDRRAHMSQMAAARWWGNVDRRECPKCHGERTHRNGHVGERQRWHCLDCVRSFTEPKPLDVWREAAALNREIAAGRRMRGAA